ncbi:MAG TPA: MASE1 domain-containing protein [Chthoniobacterales bacterium]|nr:MASE1 domain-containing protein [Chthoniobacterales bacterium]
MVPPKRFSTVSAIAALTALYFVAGKLGLHLAFLHRSASPVWPPAGIALAALLVLGYRMWPAIFIGAFLVNATTAGNVLTSLGIASGNTLEAVCGAWLVNHFAGGTKVFERARGVFQFAIAAMLSTLLSPSIGVTTLALGDFASWTSYWPIWLTWWLGDAAGDLIITPLILLWSIPSPRRWTRREAIEVSILLFLLVCLAEIVFGGWSSISARNYPISFICGPIVIWMAFRFSQRETATGIFILSAIAIWGTLHGAGPFVMDTENQSLLTLQTWTAVLTITAMALSAAMAERRRAEAAIEQQKSAVETANRTKDNFLAMLSHELRTPLTPVITALDSLEIDSAKTEEAKAALAMIRRNVELENQLIGDLLDLTRIAKDKLELKFDTLDAHEAVLNVIDICRAEANAKQLHLYSDLRAGAHHISGDSAKFQQIIWNLLKNAIKFTPENGEINISSTNPAPQTFTISVRDTGIGIDPEIIDRVFDPFEQGELTLRRRFGGLGLGLAISKSLAKAHGGTLVARSPGRDKGTTFLLTLNTVPPQQRPTASVAAPVPSRTLRILLVDDHHDTCTALEKLLVRRGHLVAATHNVRAALEAAVRNQFDLLISDLALPDGTGMNLMMQVRAICGMPGIAISGFGTNGDIERSLQAGFAEHLTKPVNLERLEAAMKRVVGSSVAAR